MWLRQYVRYPQHGGRNPRRDMLDVPSVLYGQAEICRYRRPNRAIPKEVRQRLHQKGPKRPAAIAGFAVIIADSG